MLTSTYLLSSISTLEVQRVVCSVWEWEIPGGEYGIMDISGERWREHRKFAVLQLRELGVGKPLMEEKILVEAEELIKKLTAADRHGQEFVLQVGIRIVYVSNWSRGWSQN